MERKRYISVILPLKLEWEPCYMSAQAQVGDRVRVKFAFHEYVGVVSGTDIQPEIDPGRIQDIISIEHGLERILPEEIAFWREIAGYYLCTVGEVYKAAYPAMKVSLEEARAAAEQKVAQRREKLLDAMRAKVRKIEERLKKKQELLDRSKAGTKAGEKHAADFKKISGDLDMAVRALEEAERNSLVQMTGKAGMLTGKPETQVGYEGRCDDQEGHLWDINSDPELSPAQTKAYDDIRKGFEAGKPVLLHGVTGSGKTEIYIKLAKDTLRQGRNVLYLVPEIALSRQLEERLREHFAETLLVFHSGESAVSRRSTAERIRESAISRKSTDERIREAAGKQGLMHEGNGGSSHGYIVLGTRSSLFLPHHDLGLIIIDEEHDSSYKQDSPAPRYNGRDAALMLSAIHTRISGKACRTLLGSATPSLEELYNCQFGRHELVSLKERYHGSQDIEVEIVDTRAERRKNGMVGNFSRKLLSRIEEAVRNGGQVMILRSRRAWSPVLQCESCGEIAKCPHCNVSLSLHAGQTGPQSSGIMVCHYCGFKKAYNQSCSSCGGKLKQLGAGTQKIEEEIQQLIPDARVARLDSDTAQNKSYESRIIKDFAKGEIDILVGTQMVTKGFDFSGVSVVAVIAADSLLGMQDFRADEKAAQLLEQFRGRCGRRGGRGIFIIQTSQPEHPVYKSLTSGKNQDYTGFLMQERKDFIFPPYARIIEITIRDANRKRAGRMAEKLAEALMETGYGQITGPYEPSVSRIADQHIRCLRISLRKDRNLRSAKSGIWNSVKEFEKACRYEGHIVLNVDPS